MSNITSECSYPYPEETSCELNEAPILSIGTQTNFFPTKEASTQYKNATVKSVATQTSPLMADAQTQTTYRSDVTSQTSVVVGDDDQDEEDASKYIYSSLLF